MRQDNCPIGGEPCQSLCVEPCSVAKRSCTCHPDDNPPVPCAKRYALSECRAAQPIAWRWDEATYRPGDLRGRQWVHNRYAGRPPYIDEMVQNVTPLYTHPPRREWRSLSDDEIDGLTWRPDGVMLNTHLEFARAVEQALKELNHE